MNVGHKTHVLFQISVSHSLKNFVKMLFIHTESPLGDGCSTLTSSFVFCGTNTQFYIAIFSENMSKKFEMVGY